MSEKPSFFNWSLAKILATETGTFNLARIKILYFILVFSLVKIAITLTTAVIYDQPFQFWRGIFFLIIYTLFLKLLLSNKNNVPVLTHLMVVSGVLITWSIIFISAQKINIITLQFVFMIILSSFYLLNKTWGFIYSLLAVLPVILYLIIIQSSVLDIPRKPEELAYPGQLLVTILNFITFTVTHYLYREAFNETVDEKQMLNERLQFALKDAEKYAKSKSDFLSTMSHELRTPLSIVIGMTELLKETPHDDEQDENIKMLNFAAGNLHAIINDILDYNKIGSGKIQLERVNLKLYDLVHSICSGLEIQAREKGLKLILEADEKLKNLYVVTDPIRLSQIVYNLLGNSIKFTSIGTLKLTLTTGKITDESINVHFSFKDTGIGISQEQQQLIFEPFVQASSNTTRTYGGTGLGLSIVKQLLELFNSKIELDSAPGKGSHFYFDIAFPLGKQGLPQHETSQVDQRTLKGLKVLVAEDNILNTFLIRKLCSKWEIDPVIVQNGREALEEVAKGEYQVLLMDLHMPEMDGYEAAKAIRKMQKGSRENLTIIAVSASVSSDLEDKINEIDMDDFVRKPFSANELYLKLRQVAELRMKPH